MTQGLFGILQIFLTTEKSKYFQPKNLVTMCVIVNKTVPKLSKRGLYKGPDNHHLWVLKSIIIGFSGRDKIENSENETA